MSLITLKIFEEQSVAAQAKIPIAIGMRQHEVKMKLKQI